MSLALNLMRIFLVSNMIKEMHIKMGTDEFDRALYDDIVASKETWMTFFDERGNALQAEHTSALLVKMLLDIHKL